MNCARAAHTSTLLPSGLVLIAGGLGECPQGYNRRDQPLDTAELYDSQRQTFTPTGPLNWARFGADAVLVCRP
jgi:hypothetical protein